MPPAVAKDMLESSNWVLVDIRPENKYESAHPAGAKNVQLYRKVCPTDLCEPKPSCQRLQKTLMAATGCLMLRCTLLECTPVLT